MGSRQAPHASLYVGIDVGGTFTDVVAVDRDTGVVLIARKVLSTPEDPSEAFLAALASLRDLLSAGGAKPVVCHGTTVATNTLIEKRGARTALLTTAGFRDVLELRRQLRPQLYRLAQRVSPPLVPRPLRLEVTERVAFDGSVLVPVDRASTRAVLQVLQQEDVEAVAICFLHSYANPQHEAEVRRAVASALPDVFVTASSELGREFREYERTSTTVVNAYVGPRVSHYVGQLRQELHRRGIHRFALVKSNGGLTAPGHAERFPVHLIESGPAAGLVAAMELGRARGWENLIAFDMGGTTAKAGVVRAGHVRFAPEFYADRFVDAEDVGGYAIAVPSIDLVEIGVGGGSIAWLDPAGVPKVGPRSAGSDPGPACYGRGGRAPTVTDAHVVLGTLDPLRFNAGQMPLFPGLARAAIEEGIARPLGWTVERAAAAIVTIATHNMVEMVRLATVRRGLDPRDFALVAYGGAGPLFAAAIARELGIRRVVIPPYPGMFSAIGTVLCDVRHDLVQTILTDLHALGPEVLGAVMAQLEEQARALLAAEDLTGSGGVHLHRFLDLRFKGQIFEITVPLGSGRSLPRADEIERSFRYLYHENYGYDLPDTPVEVVNARLIASHRDPRVRFPAYVEVAEVGATVGARPVVAPDGSVRPHSVWRKASLPEGEPVPGPLLVEDAGATVWVLPGQWVRKDAGVLVITEGEGA